MDVLYKYVMADRAMTCLPEIGDGTLRATQPSSLNDPFECAAIFHPVGGDSADEEAQTHRAYARGLTEIHEENPISSCDVRRAREKYGSLFGRELLARQLSRKFGVVSFAADHLNLLLWSHYTIDGSGFVIGYDFKELQKLGGTRDRLRPVAYTSQPFRIGVSLDDVRSANTSKPRDSDWLIPLSRKSKHWEYEQEWRLIVDLNQTIGTGETDRHQQPINLVRVPNEAVVSVFYTERTPLQIVDKVSVRLANPNNRYTSKHLRKLKLSPNSYDYVEDSLN